MSFDRKLSRDQTLRSLVGKISELPTLPHVVYKVLQVLNNPNASIRQIAEVLEQDVSLSAQVLRLANSGFYSHGGGATTIDRAITSIGMDSVSQLVFTAAVFNQFELNSVPSFNVREFWKHSLGVAIASETIAQSLGHRDPSLIYLSGLVHDIGKLVYFQLHRDEWLQVCEWARLERQTIAEAETTLETIPHAELGYELTRHWRLPLMIQEVALGHHSSMTLINDIEISENAQAVQIVNLANLLVHSLRYGHSGHNAIRNPKKDLVVRTLGDDANLMPLIHKVHASLSRSEQLLISVAGAETTRPSAN